ncbi:ABC transporter ATP-binding protein [Natronorubrum halophilum]|uniref:ABC transporter ATP-binding protein n=1 Tax=Natronorubrum halophilum TaxID=1702106 RepID=UPI0010C22120|nr:oligopeptide/dipeptide ABC transporter ATP-binding protein [Natronorubrum halophilum]
MSTIDQRDTDDRTDRIDGREPLLEVTDLQKHFPVHSGLFASVRFDRDSDGFPVRFDESSVKAVDGVGFSVDSGETLGVVGESGCGKSTLARTIVGLEEPTAGEVRFDGERTDEIEESEFRKRTQMVFQDPQSSLNGRRKIGHIIEDPLEGAGWEKSRRQERSLELLEQVGLKREYYSRYPHEFSGGQRQRINLARSLSINPDLIIADEPVSGLDVSVQAQILNLMDDLQEEYGLTYLLISHDLSVVRYIADRVAVMYLGEFVELSPTEELFTDQHHPYTRSLLRSVPNPDPDQPGVQSVLGGSVPSASDPPRGCRFHTRCPDLILPDGFSSDGYEAYDQLLADIRDRTIDADADDSNTVVDAYLGDADGVPSAARGDAERAAERALEGEWETARETLEAHESVCQSTAPALESTAPDRVAACHLEADERGDDREP